MKKTASQIADEVLAKTTETDKKKIPASHRALVGLMGVGGPVMGGPAAALAAPKGRGSAQLWGTGLGALGGGLASEQLAYLLTKNPRLRILATLLGSAGGGLLGQEVTGY